MTAGQDHIIGLDRVNSLIMDIFVCHHVIVETKALHPIDKIEIEVEFSQIGIRLAEAGPLGLVFRPHVKNRPQARGITHARAVRMGIVERCTILPVLIEKQMCVVHDRDLSGQ